MSLILQSFISFFLYFQLLLFIFSSFVHLFKLFLYYIYDPIRCG